VTLATRTLTAHKALDLVVLKVKELCSFADYFLICSGTSRRHVLALAQHLEEDLARAGLKPLGLEGLKEGLWVLLDYNGAVIHIFSQALREFYNLEGLWAEAPQVTVERGRIRLPRSPSAGKTLSEPQQGPP
jgi:ribosome-associated protein